MCSSKTDKIKHRNVETYEEKIGLSERLLRESLSPPEWYR